MRTLTVRRPLAPLALASTLLVAFVMLFAWPQAAAAHDQLVDSDPAAGSTVEAMPSELTLTFSAALIDGEGSTEVVVLDADENDITVGEPEIDGAMVIQQLDADAAAGEYRVIWKVVSSDGHPTSEEFSFTVTAASAPSPAETAAAPASPSPSASPSATQPAPADDADDPTAGAPADGDSFLRALPWIIGGVLLVAAGGALVFVLVARARRKPVESDSDGPAEG